MGYKNFVSVFYRILPLKMTFFEKTFQFKKIFNCISQNLTFRTSQFNLLVLESVSEIIFEKN